MFVTDQRDSWVQTDIDFLTQNEFKRLIEFEKNQKFVDKVMKGQESLLDQIEEINEESQSSQSRLFAPNSLK